MNVRFTTKQMEITPEIRSYCEKRLRTIGKLLRPPIDVDIVLSVEKYRSKAEINLKAKGIVAVAEEASADLMLALGKVFDSLEKRVKREREKIREKKRRLSLKQRRQALVETGVIAEGEKEKKIIRMDDYSLKPMTLEEAIMQLDLKRKDVFVFRREDGKRLAVILRRRDGHYGLIEPE